MKSAFQFVAPVPCLGLLALCVPARAKPITGRIVDRDGKPVPHVAVRVVVLSVEGDGRGTTRKLSTDASGVFSLNVSPAVLAKGKKEHLLGQVRVLSPRYALRDWWWKTPDQKFVVAPGHAWGGVVLGNDEKPLAGVRVALRSLRLAGEPQTYLSSGETVTQTDANGRWTMNSMPLAGSASIAIADPRFQGQTFDLSLDQPGAPPLFVKAGASVTGRLLAPDKTPIVGAIIGSFEEGTAPARTDAQGRFTLPGFAPGDASLFSFDHQPLAKPRPYMIPRREVAQLKAGETRDIGDWMADKGILVSGQVVDGATKKPLTGIGVTVQDTESHDVSTDAKGRFEARVSDKNELSVSLVGGGYLRRWLSNVSLSHDKNSGRVQLAPIELERGVQVAGTARLQNGAPFDQLSSQPFTLSATMRGQDAQVAWGSADGTFSFGALEPGVYNLKVGAPPGYINLPNLFALVSPGSLVVPPVGQKMAPLHVVLKPLAAPGTATTGTPTRLEGRVLDDVGHPIAGAVINLKNANNVYPTRLVSGADGRYKMVAMPSDVKLSVASIERPGFVGVPGAKIERAGDALLVSDVVLKRRGARFVGRVVDDKGQPVAGASVAPIEAGIEPAQSAADGTFVLLDLPAGECSLLAAKDHLSARLQTNASTQNVELRLAPPGVIDTQALAQKWMARGPGFWVQNDFIEALGPDRMERMLLRHSLDAAGNPIPGRAGEVFIWFVRSAAKRDPDWTRRHADELLSMFGEEPAKKEAETGIALVRAQSTDASERKWASDWLERALTEKNGATASRYLDVAAVARALKRPEAATSVEFAAQLAAQMPPETQLDHAKDWGQQLAPFDEKTVASFIDEWSAPAQLAAWSGAVEGFSDAGDTGAARRALHTLDGLAKSPAVRAAQQGEAGSRSYNTSPELLLDSAHGAFVRALAKQNPAAALTEASQVQDVFAHQDALLQVANAARLCGDKTVVATAVRQVFDIGVGNAEPYALAAWYGVEVDPALGADLFARARAKVEARGVGSPDAGIGSLAYYFGRRDPALCRLLIEREWAERMNTLSSGDKTGESFDNPSAEPTKLVRAMLVIDPARGAEMATQLEAAEQGTRDSGSARARQRIGWIIALVADEAAQARGDLEETRMF